MKITIYLEIHFEYFHGRDLVTRYQRTQYNKHRTTILVKTMNRIGYNEITLHCVIKTD
nr:MAG TPA: hypothetical protein [Caudoviricetes sp.]